MSNLQNEIQNEKLLKAFEEAFSTDEQLRTFLANQVLTGFDFYGFLFCGERALLRKKKDEIFKVVKEVFYESEEGCFDIRALCERAYDMEIEQEPREDY